MTTARTTNVPNQDATWISAKNLKSTYSPGQTITFTVTTPKNVNNIAVWVFREKGSPLAKYDRYPVKNKVTGNTVKTSISLSDGKIFKSNKYYVIFQEPGYNKKLDVQMNMNNDQTWRIDSTSGGSDMYPNWQSMSGKTLYDIIKSEIKTNSDDSCTSLEFKVK